MQTHLFRPAKVRWLPRSQDLIPQRHSRAVVQRLSSLGAVVPAVDLGTADHPSEGADVPSHIRMHGHALQQDEHRGPGQRFGCEAQAPPQQAAGDHIPSQVDWVYPHTVARIDL